MSAAKKQLHQLRGVVRKEDVPCKLTDHWAACMVKHALSFRAQHGTGDESTQRLQVNTAETETRHDSHDLMVCRLTFSCLPMGTALSALCTFAVRQSCLLVPAALAVVPAGVASVAAAAALEPRAPPAFAAVLDLLLAGCFCSTHKHTCVTCRKSFKSFASTA